MSTLRNDLIEPELIALSRLLYIWSQPEVQARHTDIPKKIKAFRKALVAGKRPKGQKGGIRHKVAPEIVADEHAMAEVLIDAVINDSKRVEICSGRGPKDNHITYCLQVDIVKGIPRIFTRKLKVTHSIVKDLVNHLGENHKKKIVGRRPKQELAIAIVMDRLSIGKDAVKDARNPKRTFGDPIPARTTYQQILAASYLDIARSDANRKLTGLVLDSLGSSWYSPLMLYYLIQAAYRKDRGIYPIYLPSEVRGLSKEVIRQAGRDRCPRFCGWMNKPGN